MLSLPDLAVQLYSGRQPLAEDFAAGLTAPTTHQALDGGDLEAIFETCRQARHPDSGPPFTPADRW